jgi:glucose-1-phosphate adenylyltransferase
MDKVLAIIMAGGRGERLSILSQVRTKPAVPFAGKYRIIDFTLSNAVISGISKVVVLTQYEPLSLADHIGIGAPWGLATPDRGIRLLQPYLAREEKRDWYKGTADAIYQNLQFIEEQNAELVLILSGDHVYSMDYSRMIGFHQDAQADVTMAVTLFPEEELERFGTVMVDDAWQVTGFQEKVKKPKSNLVSMGVYLFKKDILKQWLELDARNMASRHDFGRNVFPVMVGNSKIFAYKFEGYWRDIGTVQSYWQANMDLMHLFPSPLFNPGWPIRTKEDGRPAAIISETADVTNSLICDGSLIEGRVEHSVLSPGVVVAEGAVVKDTIIMNDCIIGQGSTIDYSILDKEVEVEAGCHIGFGDDFQVNRRDPKTLDSGITLIGKRARIPLGARIGRNCVVGSGVSEDDFPTHEVQSGETIMPKRIRRA